MNKQLKRQLGIAAVVVGLAAPLTANAEHRNSDGDWVLRAMIGAYAYGDGDGYRQYRRHQRRHTVDHRRHHWRANGTHRRWHWRNDRRRDGFYGYDHAGLHHSGQHRQGDFHHEQRHHRF